MIALSNSEIHVSKASLNVDAGAVAMLHGVLSTDEIERARRFHFDRDSRRFIVARGTLRHLLSRHTGIAPQELRFQYSAYGKPELQHESGVRFNLSHSGEVALIAIAMGAESA